MQSAIPTSYPGRFRFLWMLLALTFPLFALESLRMESESSNVHIAVPMVVLIFLIGGTFAASAFSMGGRAKGAVFNRLRLRQLAFLAFLYLTWCSVTLFRSEDLRLAIKELIKVGVGIVCVWTIVASFPRDRRFFERFWVWVIHCSALLILVLIYRYAFFFHSHYLGSAWEEASKGGRNQLSWYVTVISPLALAYFRNSQKRLLAGVPLAILLTALVYLGSRGAWISTLVSFLAMVFLLARRGRSIGTSLRLTAIVAGSIGLCIYLLAAFVDMTENTQRLIYIFRPDEVPELSSYETRFGRIDYAWSLFLEYPLMGSGFGNTQFYAHNDYMTIIADTGIVGLGIFMGMILLFLRSLGIRQALDRSASWLSVSYRGMVVGVLVSMVMTNTYTMPMWWVLVGLGLVLSEIERLPSAPVPGRPESPGEDERPAPSQAHPALTV